MLPSSVSRPVDHGVSQLSEGSPYSRGVQRSYVLLSACAPTEDAHESGGFGLFSSALLDLLSTVPLNKLRYCEIPSRIQPLPRWVGLVCLLLSQLISSLGILNKIFDAKVSTHTDTYLIPILPPLHATTVVSLSSNLAAINSLCGFTYPTATNFGTFLPQSFNNANFTRSISWEILF